jgi:peptide/nickel transport system permease protein
MNTTYLARRVGTAVFTFILALVISYLLFELSPLKPIETILQSFGLEVIGGGVGGATGRINIVPTQQAVQLTSEEYKELVAYVNSLLPHGDPVLGALSYIWDVLHGNWGLSIIYDEPVLNLIAQRLPWTLFIVVSANLISFFVGVYLGQYMAYHRGGLGDQAVTQFITVKRSIPVYIYAALLIYFLGFEYHIFPTHGAYSGTPGFNLPFIASVLYHAALPIFTLAFASFGHWALSMRGNIISVLGEDYVTYAEARGLPSSWIQRRYVGRNALLPLYTGIIIALGFSFGGSIFVESTFSYPGIGQLYVNALSNDDWPVAMGILLIIVLAIVVGMVIADLTYSLIDPRVRVGGK